MTTRNTLSILALAVLACILLYNAAQNNPTFSPTIKILQTPAKEASGLEITNKWIVADDNGTIYKGDKGYKAKGDLEGLAYCNNKLYVARERSSKIKVYDNDINEIGEIVFKVGKGNNGAEGIACTNETLYVTGQNGNKVYVIDLNGKLIDSFHLPHADLSGADIVNNLLYVLSDEDDVIMVVDIESKEVIAEIEIGESKEWEGIKVVDDIIYIVEDDE